MAHAFSHRPRFRTSLDNIARVSVSKITDLASRVVVAQAFNFSTWEAEAGGSLSFEASLVYRASSRQLELLCREILFQKRKKLQIWENAVVQGVKALEAEV